MRPRAVVASLAVVVAVLSHAPGAVIASATRAVFPVTVNGVERGTVGVVIDADGAISVTADDAHVLNLDTLPSFPHDLVGTSLVRLDSVAPGTTVNLDESDLVVNVVIPAAEIGNSRLISQAVAPGTTDYRARGTTLSYALNSGFNAPLTGAAQFSTVLGGGLATTSIVPGQGSQTFAQTRWLREIPSRAADLSVGYTNVSLGTLVGSAQLLGAVYESNYAGNAFLLRQTFRGITGVAQTPSVVSIYVDGRLYRQEQLEPGSFTIQDLPVSQLGGQTRVVVRDAFGSEQTFVRDAFSDPSLLPFGRSEFQYGAGSLVSQGGAEHAGLAVLAHYAHGFAPALTGGFDVARTATATNVSPSATIATRFGIFAGGLAVSDRGEVGNGLAKIVDYRLTRGGVQFTAHYDDASANYAGAGVDSAALATTTGASRSIGAGIALPLFRRQYVSFNYSTTSQVAGTTSQVNVASTIPFLHRNINVNVAVARGGGVSNYNLGLSSSFRFGKTSGAISSQTGTTGNGIDVSLSHDVENTTGVGYNLDANSTGGINVLGTIEDRTPALLTTLDLFASGAGRPSYALGTSGALLFGGGTVTPTAQLGSSYAVVEAGVPHLRVYLNDQLAGTTDRNGRLVLPSLAAYHDNVVLVEPPAGDLTMTIVDPQRTVNVPASRGAVLRFHVSRSRAAIGTLVYERAGVRTEAKLGTLVVNNADVRFESPLGTDGRFFFESLPAGTYDARAQAPNGTSCAFRLHVPEAATQFVRLGEIACPVNS